MDHDFFSINNNKKKHFKVYTLTTIETTNGNKSI